MKRPTIVRMILIGILGTATSTGAYAITWTFTGRGGEGTIRDVRTFTTGGITITATA